MRAVVGFVLLVAPLAGGARAPSMSEAEGLDTSDAFSLGQGNSTGGSGGGSRWKAWEICEDVPMTSKLDTMATYCFKISAVAYHCFAVATTEKDTMMFELGAEQDGEATVACHHISKEQLESPALLANSSFMTAAGDAQPQQPAKPVPPCFGAWKDKGYVDDSSKCTYPATLEGLEAWVDGYLSEFPRYEVASTNCQKFSVGIYNSATHSNAKEKQRMAMASLNFFGKIWGKIASSTAASRRTITDSSMP